MRKFESEQRDDHFHDASKKNAWDFFKAEKQRDLIPRNDIIIFSPYAALIIRSRYI